MNKKIMLLVFIIFFLGGLMYYFGFRETIPSDTISSTGSGFVEKSVSETGSLNGYTEIVKSNPRFTEGMSLMQDNDFSGAIVLFESIKKGTSRKDQAILDFNISVGKMKLDHVQGVKSFIALANETAYPPRTRALAMQRAYFYHRKFLGDNALTQALAKEVGISWISENEGSLLYFKKINDIYLMATPLILLTMDGIKKTSDKIVAQGLYEGISTRIDTLLANMKNNPGEVDELQFAMRDKARLLDLLHTKFNIIPKKTVEEEYQKSIDFARKTLRIRNKQVALIYYANFLATIGDKVKAQEILSIIANDSLDGDVAKALPYYEDFGVLKSMTGMTDEKINKFIMILNSNK